MVVGWGVGPGRALAKATAGEKGEGRGWTWGLTKPKTMMAPNNVI